MKKQLLFIIDSLNAGGAEKSLVTLLSLLEYSHFDVDLQLFAGKGLFCQFLPPQVNVLSEFSVIHELSQPLWKQLWHPRILITRLRYSLKTLDFRLSIADKAVLYWQIFGAYFDKPMKNYDIAIAYAQGVPTFYLADKISAKRKLAWVNIDYRLKGRALDFQRSFYDRCNTIVCVSEFTREFFASEVYPEFRNKMEIMLDIIDSSIICNMAQSPSEQPIDTSLPVIMTVGRLNKPQKGYDLALKTTKILKDRGVKFCWYAIGEGAYRSEMERYIAENDLQNCFILLGSTANPYSYMRQCDIYVQTSRHEGFGLTIAEARILNKPVVCTNFEGCTMQMVNEKNGLITSFNPEDIADAIERLLNDKTLYLNIQEYLRNEKKGNVEDIEKFYELIEG